jgi:hypothetical protein
MNDAEFIETFKARPPVQRKLFLAQMAVNHTDSDGRHLHAVLSELDETLGDFYG